MTGQNQILLLCTKDKPRTCKNEDDTYINVHAAFPLTEDNLSELIIKALLQLSDKPYIEWENNKIELKNRYEEVNLFVMGDIKEFCFEEKNFFLLNFELDNPSEKSKTTTNTFSGDSPVVKVFFDETYSYPVSVSTNTLRIETLPFKVPVITKDSYPGLSLHFDMPFKITDKKFYMFDRQGNQIGGPYIWAEPLDYDFYSVGMEENKGYIINRYGRKLTEEGIEVEEFNILYGFIFITKNKKWGFVSELGEVCNPMFDEVKEIKDGSRIGPIEVRLGDKWGFVSKDFEFVTEEQLKFQKYKLFDYSDYIY